MDISILTTIICDSMVSNSPKWLFLFNNKKKNNARNGFNEARGHLLMRGGKLLHTCTLSKDMIKIKSITYSSCTVDIIVQINFFWICEEKYGCVCVCSCSKQVNDGVQYGKWNLVRVVVAAVYPRHTAALNNLLSAASCGSELHTPTLSPTPTLSFGKENIIFISSSKQFQCRFIKPQLLNESIPDELSPKSPACLWML